MPIRPAASNGKITNNGTTTVNEGTLLLNKSSGPQILGNLTIGNATTDNSGQDSDVVRYGLNATTGTIPSNVTVTINQTGELDLNNKAETISTTLSMQLGVGARRCADRADRLADVGQRSHVHNSFGDHSRLTGRQYRHAGRLARPERRDRTMNVPDGAALVDVAIPANISGSLTTLLKTGAGTLALAGRTPSRVRRLSAHRSAADQRGGHRQSQRRVHILVQRRECHVASELHQPRSS